jgi:hypothetical protein
MGDAWAKAVPAFFELRKDLEADRAVPGDHERVVVRVDDRLSAGGR